MKPNNLLLVTTAGVISGTPVASIDDTDNTDNTTDLATSLTSVAHQMAITYRKENNISPNSPLDNTDGYIALKDVTIRNGNTGIDTPFLCVFFDQIIGISFGNIN